MALVNKAIASLTPKDMAEDIGVPFHPGAAKFYKEAGIDRESPRRGHELSVAHGASPRKARLRVPVGERASDHEALS